MADEEESHNGLSLPLSECVWKDAGTAGGPSAHLEHVVLDLRVLDGQLEARDDFVDFFLEPYKNAFDGFWEQLYEILNELPVNQDFRPKT